MLCLNRVWCVFVYRTHLCFRKTPFKRVCGYRCKNHVILVLKGMKSHFGKTSSVVCTHARSLLLGIFFSLNFVCSFFVLIRFFVSIIDDDFSVFPSLLALSSIISSFSFGHRWNFTFDRLFHLIDKAAEGKSLVQIIE